jgi:heat shock protein HslJ
MRSTTLLALTVLAVTIIGCTNDRNGSSGGGTNADASMTRPPPDRSKPTSVTGVDWVLTRLGDEAALPDKPYKARPWFHLDPGEKRRVTGNTSVNSISGTYELSGGALQFGPMISTRRAGDPALMRQESGFLNALEKTATAEVEGRMLTLRDAGRSALATFEALQVTP